MLPSGIERDPVEPSSSRISSETRRIPGWHFLVTSVRLLDRSDLTNALVHEQQWLMHVSEDVVLTDNLFCVEALDQNRQWIYICTAPLFHVWPRTGAEVRLRLSREKELLLDLPESVKGGKWIALETEAGVFPRARALQEWQRTSRPPKPSHQIPSFLSNTWGDRSRDARMNEAFMLGEIEAAARLGVDVVQLDDGWQKGVTSNSVYAAQGGVWEGFWSADPEFWAVHPVRFPNGLQPLSDLAEEKGVALGLWFAPDSWNDFANWERDARALLGYHQRFGVCHFKLDGIKIHSETALERLRSFVRSVQDGSGGEVVFDLDITAESRPGHFGIIECGPLFIENRYTDWVNHWPHQTLRNLWQLSRWVDPPRIRMEFLNPDRNPDLYGDDPLAPACYRADCLFAMVMCANPLGWFEVTGLSEKRAEEVRMLTSLWKTHREEMAKGTVVPVGDCPDGHNHCGFLVVPRDAAGRWYLVWFRGNTVREEWEGDVSVAVPESWHVLAGGGEANGKGRRLSCAVNEKLGYVFATNSPR